MGIGGALHGSSLGGALHGAGVHKFDTGLHRAQRTTLRDAIIHRLELRLLKSNGGYVDAVKALPRPLRQVEDGDPLIARALGGQTLAVLVALGRKTYEPSDLEAVLTRGEISVFVYVVSAHKRDLVDGRLAADVAADGSASADPGIEVALEQIEESLLGQELDIKGVSEIRPLEEDESYTFADVTVWEQSYRVKVERKINPSRANTIIVTSLQGDHRPDEIPEVHPLSPTVRTIAELEE